MNCFYPILPSIIKISIFFLNGKPTITCKNEEDPIKNVGARVFTTLYINFSDVQGQNTPEMVLVSGRNLDSSKPSCMSSLPVRMRLIESKVKELEFLQSDQFRTRPRCYEGPRYLQV